MLPPSPGGRSDAREGTPGTAGLAEMAETDPDSLAQLETTAADGTQWVPYVENGQGQDSATTTAGTGTNDGAGNAGSSPNSAMSSRSVRTNRGG